MTEWRSALADLAGAAGPGAHAPTGRTPDAAVSYGTWVPYGGAARLVLAVILLAAVAAIVFAGLRLPLPAGLPRPGKKAAAAMLAAWVLALVSFPVCLVIYVEQAQRRFAGHGVPQDRIFPVTFVAAGVTCFIIAVSSQQGGRTALLGAISGAMAGPMVFEFPFDFIVMARTYPPIPPDPALYRVLFFAPLFLIEVTTLALLTLSPLAKLARATFFSFALMLAVFAVWALAGFGYPSAPLPFTLNVISKLLAFATVLTLFLRRQPHAEASGTGTAQPEPQAAS